MGILVASYLAHGDLPILDRVTWRLGVLLGARTTLVEGTSYADVAAGRYDVALLCGLAYVQLVDDDAVPLRPLCAPVYGGRRHDGRPIYESDVVVRGGHAAQSLPKLAGATVALNEPRSYSGVGVLGHALAVRGLGWDLFGRVLWTGSHEASLAAVSDGDADVASIDSHVMDRPLPPERPLRVIERLGPSPTQPVVAHARLSSRLQVDAAAALCSLQSDDVVRDPLRAGGYAGFARVDDSTYDPIRATRSPG